MAKCRHVNLLHRFLRQRGWRKVYGSWWYKPRPEWGDRCPMGVELFGTRRAFDLEMKAGRTLG